MRALALACTFATTVALVVSGCETAPKSTEQRAALETEVQAAIRVARDTDPGLQRFFDTAAGYAVFPDVGKGAFVAGGAFGRGILFEGGQPTGYCSLTQASVGAAVGGQKYTEIIFFETPDALSRFKAGDYTLAAQASAVALKSGASSNAKYADNVLVFTMGEAGLMVEAAIGGQRFSFEPFTATAPGIERAIYRTAPQ